MLTPEDRAALRKAAMDRFSSPEILEAYHQRTMTYERLYRRATERRMPTDAHMSEKFNFTG